MGSISERDCTPTTQGLNKGGIPRTPCEKLQIAPNKKFYKRKIILLLPEYYEKCACSRTINTKINL